MKIGIDASLLTESKRTGTGNYLYNVIKVFAREDKLNTYIVYFKDSPSTEFIDDLFNQNPNFTHKTLKKFISWTQLSLAYYSMTDGVDMLFCTWHTVPILHSPKIKLISVIHDMQLKTSSPLFNLATILLSSKVIAVSNATKNDILSYLPFTNNKIQVIYEGVDTSVFKRSDNNAIKIVKSRYNLGSRYLICVGTISHRKNVPNMIEAFAQCVKKSTEFSDLELILAGSVTPEYRNIYDLPIRLGISERVKFLGYIPAFDLPALLSGSSGLLYASRAEGFGLPILEAMSCGIPVLTSNMSSMTEVAGDAAILVSPNSIDSISNGIIELVSKSSQLVSKGYDNVSKYSWDNCGVTILNLFKKYEH